MTETIKKAGAATRRPGRPKLNEQGDTSGRILAVALEEFATNGFDGGSLAEIARQAGVAKPLVNYHFGNKEQLWRAAVQHAFGEMMQQFITLPHELKDLDAISFAKVFIRKYVRFVAQHPALGRVIVIEGYKDNERSRWLLENHVIPMHSMAVTLIEGAQARGVIRPVPAAQLVAMINGSINVFFNEAIMQGRVGGGVVMDEATIESFADNLLVVFASGVLINT